MLWTCCIAFSTCQPSRKTTTDVHAKSVQSASQRGEVTATEPFLELLTAVHGFEVRYWTFSFTGVEGLHAGAVRGGAEGGRALNTLL